MEYIWCTLNVEKRTVHYVVVYRPPSGSHSKFREKFISLLEDIDANNSDFIVAGDFNIHMDNPHSPDTQNFTQILADFGLRSHTSGPTHIGGHTLDLVITRQDSDLIKNVDTDDIISDHLMLCFTLSLRQKEVEQKTTMRRSFKNFDVDAFDAELKESELCTTPADDIDDLVTQYNETLSLLLDKYAPVATSNQNRKRKTPWYKKDIHIKRQKRRQLTRKWRKSGSPNDKESMITQRNKVSDMIHSAKSDYYHSEIAKAGKDSKTLFRIFNQLLNDNKTNPMPPSRTSKQNANDFNKYFIEKIKGLKARFTINSDHSYLDGEKIEQSMTEFQQITLEKTKRLILAAPSK